MKAALFLLATGLCASAQTMPPRSPSSEALNQKHTDLNGIWLCVFGTYGTDDYQVVQLRIVQAGDDVRALVVGAVIDGKEPEIFHGKFVTDDRIDGRSVVSWPPNLQIAPEQVEVRDGQLYFDSAPAPFNRVPAVVQGEIPCDARNSYHITPDTADRMALPASKRNDYGRVACLLRIMANAGNVRAQSLLAEQLYEGRGVAPDYAEAFRLASDSAKKIDSVAWRLLGRMYAEGKGVAADPEKAAYWTKKADVNDAAWARAKANMSNPVNQALWSLGSAALNASLPTQAEMEEQEEVERTLRNNPAMSRSEAESIVRREREDNGRQGLLFDQARKEIQAQGTQKPAQKPPQ